MYMPACVTLSRSGTRIFPQSGRAAHMFNPAAQPHGHPTFFRLHTQNFSIPFSLTRYRRSCMMAACRHERNVQQRREAALHTYTKGESDLDPDPRRSDLPWTR